MVSSLVIIIKRGVSCIGKDYVLNYNFSMLINSLYWNVHLVLSSVNWIWTSCCYCIYIATHLITYIAFGPDIESHTKLWIISVIISFSTIIYLILSYFIDK